MPRPPAAPPERPTEIAEFEPDYVRLRRDGWTAERQRAFIDALAEGGCVAEACRAVGLSTQSAYKLRRTVEAEAFRLAWDAALDYAIRRLSDAVIGRAINGVAVPHYYKGELVGEHRRYDERLAMYLLRFRDPPGFADAAGKPLKGGADELFALRLARQSLKLEIAAAKPPRHRPARRRPARDTQGDTPPDVA